MRANYHRASGAGGIEFVGLAETLCFQLVGNALIVYKVAEDEDVVALGERLSRKIDGALHPEAKSNFFRQCYSSSWHDVLGPIYRIVR